jgi:hypothetical protein
MEYLVECCGTVIMASPLLMQLVRAKRNGTLVSVFSCCAVAFPVA